MACLLSCFSCLSWFPASFRFDDEDADAAGFLADGQAGLLRDVLEDRLGGVGGVPLLLRERPVGVVVVPGERLGHALDVADHDPPADEPTEPLRELREGA